MLSGNNLRRLVRVLRHCDLNSEHSRSWVWNPVCSRTPAWFSMKFCTDILEGLSNKCGVNQRKQSTDTGFTGNKLRIGVRKTDTPYMYFLPFHIKQFLTKILVWSVAMYSQFVSDARILLQIDNCFSFISCGLLIGSPYMSHFPPCKTQRSFHLKSTRVIPHEIHLFLDNHSISQTEVS